RISFLHAAPRPVILTRTNRHPASRRPPTCATKGPLPMPRRLQLNRRRFLQATAAAGAAVPVVMSTPLYGEVRKKPNERITLGFIGVGTMGRYHLHSFLGNPEVHVLAVCDVVKERREQAQKDVEKRYSEQKGKGTYKGCLAFNDFRDLLGRREIDAVVIATPD